MPINTFVTLPGRCTDETTVQNHTGKACCKSLIEATSCGKMSETMHRVVVGRGRNFLTVGQIKPSDVASFNFGGTVVSSVHLRDRPVMTYVLIGINPSPYKF
jgi:hypothetical protein